ncbi:diacylglycerol kinase [Geomonas sp. RF6]|uniref:diacylglycerol/lipid kinase family protein n=1 Tax=Geomonas sp. RF6 TaxID=2897342 RepID=UPI001E3EF2A2|nr:diacylglycerol kinase family protein [Geomonas sp. RF6]UFS71698.1 diacylglycerol kinase [Geomonas sp. RF6]
MPLPERDSAPTSPPIFIVMNAGSGKEDVKTREATIRQVLSDAKREHRLWPVRNAEQLSVAAREAVALARERSGIVVAAGGDGTINSVVQAVLGSGRPFGVLPQGTFNYFSRTHGIPLDTAEATAALLDGVVRPVQVGLVNGRAFLVNASVGLYPRLLENREAHKRQFGRTRLVALFSALMTVLRPPRQMALTLEEGGEKRVVTTPTLVVDNNALQLEQVGLPEAHAVKRGELAAVTVQARGVFEMLVLLGYAALGKLAKAEKVLSFPFETLTVKPLRRRRIKVATDGEIVWLAPPLVFTVAPDPLLLVLPAPKEAPASSAAPALAVTA